MKMEIITDQNVWDIPEEKSLSLNTYIKKEDLSKICDLCSHLKKLVKQEQIQSKEINNKTKNKN